MPTTPRAYPFAAATACNDSAQHVQSHGMHWTCHATRTLRAIPDIRLVSGQCYDELHDADAQ
eukprot:10170877-Alexandrium_andersonii.AAC.1